MIVAVRGYNHIWHQYQPGRRIEMYDLLHAPRFQKIDNDWQIFRHCYHFFVFKTARTMINHKTNSILNFTFMQKIRIKIKGYDAKVVDKAALLILETAVRTGAKTFGPIPLPILLIPEILSIRQKSHLHLKY